MIWEDERYVRVYTRDTPEWLALSFDAQALFLLLLRKVNRAGLLPLGKIGHKAVAHVIGHGGSWERLEPALEELLADGCAKIVGDTLAIPNFIAAQEAITTGAQRTRDWRERRGAQELADAVSRDVSSRHVTTPPPPRDATSQIGDVSSHFVTRPPPLVTRPPTVVTPSIPSVPSEPSVPSVSDAVAPLPCRGDDSPPAGKSKKNGTDPRFAPLRLAWEQTFTQVTREEYRWQGAKDAKAVHSLLTIGLDEFRVRADRGLRAQGFAHCSTVAMLASKWNELAGQIPQRVNGNGRATPPPSTPHFIPPIPVAPPTGLPEWDAILAHYAETGPGTRDYLSESVIPSIEGGTLRLTVPDEYRAEYVSRHIEDIRASCSIPVMIQVAGSDIPF